MGYTLEKRIAASGDDGYTLGATYSSNGSTLQFIGPSGPNFSKVWTRFADLPVAGGSTITAAYVQLVADVTRNGAGLTYTIYGNDVDDATAPTSVADYDAKATTTASASFPLPDTTGGNTYDTPSLVSIFQEIIDRPGWSYGNAAQPLYKDGAAASLETSTFHSYDGSASLAALLHIEWTLLPFKVNGGSEIHGVTADWQDVVKRKRLDGQIDFQNYAIHTWDIAEMEMAAFLALQALRGQRLTSLQTTKYRSRNDRATYTSGEITALTGSHVGRRMKNVRVEFRVDVT